ncbi:S16 family serine protease [Streptacidiphilus jiangxiensis]|uniref:Lon protease (S16) C-terminal proteolytic domain-containing protein n=2 Tax=Streptacidiphilus jiangxiensis TaxID=235985 RepID=A0A1H7UDV4_STRJI|nr:S16 family serine protease [Streptacidiphilus jiangxiensis]SEL95252.1 Lon protease (S16) C-terminal proteolytic domain-containing protein [Streptacidiphilus jiangxiensis]
MLFKHKHLLDELRKRGRTAPAEIISVRTVGGGNNLRAMWASDEDLTAQWMNCWMHLRVVPKNRAEPPFEATVLTRMHTLPLEGGVVPVWYDPEDHARVVMDYEADVQGKMHNLAHGDLLMHRYDQRLGLAWTPVRDELLPVMVMAERGRGRVKATGRLGALFGPTADAAVAAVRGAAPRLLPQLGADWFAHHDLSVEEPYGDIPRGTTADDAAGAGLAIAVALVSLLGGHLVRAEVAVTGRLAADGRLEPVTDLRGRAHAAHKIYATQLVVPAGNQADGHGSAETGLELSFATDLDEAVHACLARHALRTFVPPA